MRTYQIALMPGDGIGPEQTEATLKVLRAIQERYGVGLEIIEAEAGDACLKKRGKALPEDSLATIRSSDACLKGPVGETAADVIVKLRLELDLYVNLRPIKTYPNVPALHQGVDMMIVRENTEDVYKGIEFMVDKDTSVAMRIITRGASERIAEYGFKLALKRRKKLTAIHKSNVLRVTDGLFAEVCREYSKKYPDVTYDELYVDAAAMALIRAPQIFDVMLTPNLFGDILSDEAAQVVGGVGLAPGANIGSDKALFEPIHGCAPDIAGKGIANPCSMILSSALMLRWLGERHGDERCSDAAVEIERAVMSALRERTITPDIGGNLSTIQVGEAIARKLVT